MTKMHTHNEYISQVQCCVQTQGGWPTAAWTRELDDSETQQPTYVALRKVWRLQGYTQGYLLNYNKLDNKVIY